MGRAISQRDRGAVWRGSTISTTALVIWVLVIGAAVGALVYAIGRAADEVGEIDFSLDLPGNADTPVSYAPRAMHGASPTWVAQSRSSFASAPVVADGRVLVREPLGGMSAFDAHTGAELWTADVGGAPLGVEFPPVAADGMVYATGGDVLMTNGAEVLAAAAAADSGAAPTEVPVVALDAATGAPRWTTQVRGLGGHPVRVADGDLYVNAGSLLALDRVTGGVRWSAEVGNGARGGYSEPAVRADLVAVAGGDGQVHAFDRATGAPRWSVAVAPAATSGLSGAGAVVAATDAGFVVVSPDQEPELIGDASGPGQIRALDPATGAVRWSQPVGEVSGVGTAPTVYGGTVFVPGARLEAFDVATGARRWVAPVSGASAFSFTPLAISEGVVFVPGADGRLHGLDASTGVERSTVGAPSRVEGNPTPFPPAFTGSPQDTVFLPSASRRLYAYPSAVLTDAPRPEAGR